VSAMYIMGLGWMVPLTTMARCVMLCMPRMALCTAQHSTAREEAAAAAAARCAGCVLQVECP
jgi:hypothetical protein